MPTHWHHVQVADGYLVNKRIYDSFSPSGLYSTQSFYTIVKLKGLKYSFTIYMLDKIIFITFIERWKMQKAYKYFLVLNKTPAGYELHWSECYICLIAWDVQSPVRFSAAPLTERNQSWRTVLRKAPAWACQCAGSQRVLWRRVARKHPRFVEIPVEITPILGQFLSRKNNYYFSSTFCRKQLDCLPTSAIL